jgi:hypothetical protein
MRLTPPAAVVAHPCLGRTEPPVVHIQRPTKRTDCHTFSSRYSSTRGAPVLEIVVQPQVTFVSSGG